MIDKLMNEEGEWVLWKRGLEEHMGKYFTDLFRSIGSGGEDVLCLMQTSVAEEHNAMLMKPYSEKEVRKAVFSMHANKSPGLDGFNSDFFQNYLEIVGREVSQMCISYLEAGKFPNELNETGIVLNPKKKNPETMGDLRPIALCKVPYKVMAKMVGNRLKSLLSGIISTNQSTFMKGRSIVDNAVISFEVMHYIREKRRGQEGVVAFKMDISKAYDSIEWSFLEKVMCRMGFNQQLVALIMHCISSVSYRILGQDTLVGPILP